jgi:2'-5' RNA ligase
MRCFISIDLPEKVRKEVVKIQENLPDINLKKICEENLHLTLNFLGGVPKQEIGKVKERLKKLIFPKFKLEISKLGVFNPGFIRIIWLGFKENEEIKRLKFELDRVLGEGFGGGEGFSGHITIARVKSLGKLGRGEVLNQLNKLKISSIEFEVSKIKLKKSELKKEGPEYTDLFVKSLE